MAADGQYNRTDMIRWITQAQEHIERCIQRYMSKSECRNALQHDHQIHPGLTELIWNRLEKENGEFFRAYYVRLVLIEQIRKFNILLEEQAVRTRDPSPDSLNWLRASQQNQPPKAEDMQRLDNIGWSIQQPGLIDTPFCDTQYTEMCSSIVDAPPQNARVLNMMHEFGSSSTPPPQPQDPRTGHVPHFAPQSPIPSNLEENVWMSGYDANSQYSVSPGTERNVMMRSREARYGASLAFDPNPYGSFVELTALTGVTSINSLSTDASKPTNLTRGRYGSQEYGVQK